MNHTLPVVLGDAVTVWPSPVPFFPLSEQLEDNCPLTSLKMFIQ